MPFTDDEIRYMQAWRTGDGAIVSDVPNPRGDVLMDDLCQRAYGGPYMVGESIRGPTKDLIRKLIDEHFPERIPNNGGPLVAVGKD